MASTNILLRRGNSYQDMLRAYRIIIDGQEVGKLERNSEVCMPVSAGTHKVQLKIDWCGSDEIVILVTTGTTTVLECGPNNRLGLFSLFASYLDLHVVDQVQPETSGQSSGTDEQRKRIDGQTHNSFNGASDTGHGQEKENTRKTRSSKTNRTWHKILQVPPDASMEDIRRAYRCRMSEYHPDKVAQLGEEIRAVAERKSKEINAAYEKARIERK